jgi:ferredoxin
MRKAFSIIATTPYLSKSTASKFPIKRIAIYCFLTLVAVGAVIAFAYHGAPALLIYGMFVSVPVALALIIDTRMKGHFAVEKGGWWTGIVVNGKEVAIRVDWNSCMGASSCVELAPKVFRLDWEKKKSIFDPAPLEVLDEKGDTPEKIFAAAQTCPYRAIILEDRETGERIFP